MKISDVVARRVWDSRGRPTVEVEVRGDGWAGRAIAPAGASRGEAEAVDRRDGGTRLGGMDVAGAVQSVRTVVAPALVGRDVRDQAGIDALLCSLDGTRQKAVLGGNATVATSMAVAWAAAASAGMPLWQWLRACEGVAAGEPVLLPLPEIQILGGGAHAAATLDLQDLMVVCPGATSFAEALDWTAEVYLAAGRVLAARGLPRIGVADEGGWWPQFGTNEEAIATLTEAVALAGFDPSGGEVALSLDVAASELVGSDGRYHLSLEQRSFAPDEWLGVVLGWVERYPIVMVEDPCGQHDHEGMRAFTRAVRDRVQVIGDDYLVTDAARVREAAASGACTAVLVKPNQAGTLTEARAAFVAARDAGMGAIVSARSGETEDVTIAHLAVGWAAGQFKVGSITRGERTAKWNEMLRIEESAGVTARFAGRAPLRLRT